MGRKVARARRSTIWKGSGSHCRLVPGTPKVFIIRCCCPSTLFCFSKVAGRSRDKQQTKLFEEQGNAFRRLIFCVVFPHILNWVLVCERTLPPPHSSPLPPRMSHHASQHVIICHGMSIAPTHVITAFHNNISSQMLFLDIISAEILFSPHPKWGSCF